MASALKRPAMPRSHCVQRQTKRLFVVRRDVNEAVMDAVALLRVPRSALGICASSRGAVTGCLLLRELPESPWLDCSRLGVEGQKPCLHQNCWLAGFCCWLAGVCRPLMWHAPYTVSCWPDRQADSGRHGCHCRLLLPDTGTSHHCDRKGALIHTYALRS